MTASNFKDFGIAETVHFPQHGVCCKAILALVDLAYDQVDNLARFSGHAAWGVLKGQVVCQRRIRVGECRVEVGHHAKAFFEIVKNSLVGGADFFAGGDVDMGHGALLRVGLTWFALRTVGGQWRYFD